MPPTAELENRMSRFKWASQIRPVTELAVLRCKLRIDTRVTLSTKTSAICAFRLKIGSL
jgi:hypothetical protein